MSDAPVDPLADFARRRERAAAAAAAAGQAVAEVDPEAAERLQAAAARARAGVLRVVFVGGFSSGKSTLLNALLGAALLPAKVNPCTAFPVRVGWGEALQITLHPPDGGEPVAVSPAEFRSLWQLPDEEGTNEHLDRVAYAQITAPLPLLAHGVELVDSSGLDDAPARTARTLALLGEADAAVMVLAAPRMLGPVETQLLEETILPMGLTNLFFALTMVDLLAHLPGAPSAAAALDAARARLGPRVFGVNARGAGPSSGLPAFEAALATWLVAERGQRWLDHLTTLARATEARLAERARVAAATDASQVAELEARLAAIQPRLAALESIAERVAAHVDATINDLCDALIEDLAARLNRLQRALPERLAGLPLSRLDVLRPGGQARIEAALHEASHAQLQAELDAWSAASVTTLEGKLGELRARLAAETAAFDADSAALLGRVAGERLAWTPLPPAGPAVPPGERWFATAVGVALLSPGTTLAGWSTGYEGALRGAAGRLAARLGVLAASALLGPIGWAALLVYAGVEAWMLAHAAEGQLDHQRVEAAAHASAQLRERLTGERATLHAHFVEVLAPFSRALREAATADARAVRARADQLVDDRRGARDAGAARDARFEAALHALRGALDAIEAA